MGGNLAPLEEGSPHVDAVDRARFEQLYRDHYRAVLAYCLRRTGANDAQDAATETFVVAWRRIDVVPHGEEARPWLYGVAYRVLSHRWRRRGRDRKLFERLRSRAPEPVPGPEPQVVRSTEHELVLEAAARLSGPDREVLRLTMWEELSNREIAATLDISVDAVKQRFHRAKTRLAREYERLHGPTHPPATAQEGGGR